MDARTPTIAWLTVVMLSCMALSACERATDVSSPVGAASTSSPDEAGSAQAEGTIGGSGLVSDTTFSSGAVATHEADAATVAVGPSADELMTDAPTSAGMPRDTGPHSQEHAQAQPLQPADRRFLTAARAASAYELALARLGFDQAKEPEVKLFASALVDHQQKANQALQSLAQARGVALEGSTLTPHQQARIDELKGSSGGDFDARFLNVAGIEVQTSQIALFEKANQGVSDPAVKAFAGATLQSLKHHLNSAKVLQQAQAHAQHASPLP